MDISSNMPDFPAISGSRIFTSVPVRERTEPSFLDRSPLKKKSDKFETDECIIEKNTKKRRKETEKQGMPI
jgi:hypothetical protein